MLGSPETLNCATPRWTNAKLPAASALPGVAPGMRAGTTRARRMTARTVRCRRVPPVRATTSRCLSLCHPSRLAARSHFPMPLSLSLNVQDLARSLPAYKALGFKVDDEWKDDEDGSTYYAELSLEGAEIGLAHIPSNDDPDFQKWVSTPLGAGVVAYIPVRDVGKLHERAKKT